MKNLIILLFLSVIVSACQEEPEQEFSAAYPVAGDWYVVYDYEDGTALGEDHLLIYNTANAPDSAWVEDGVFYGAKVRVHVDEAQFSVTNGEDIAFGSGLVTITGEVFEQDSIYVTFVYEDTGETVVAYGHRATGFE